MTSWRSRLQRMKSSVRPGATFSSRTIGSPGRGLVGSPPWMLLGLYSIRYEVIDFSPWGRASVRVLVVLSLTGIGDRLIGPLPSCRSGHVGSGVEALLPLLLRVGDGVAGEVGVGAGGDLAQTGPLIARRGLSCHLGPGPVRPPRRHACDWPGSGTRASRRPSASS